MQDQHHHAPLSSFSSRSLALCHRPGSRNGRSGHVVSDLGYLMRCPRYTYVKFLTITIHLLSSIYTLPTHRLSSERHLDPAGATDGLYTMFILARLIADSPLPLLGPHLPTLVISTLACFTIQNLSHIITPRILGKKWEVFDKKTKKGWASHCVCTFPILRRAGS